MYVVYRVVSLIPDLLPRLMSGRTMYIDQAGSSQDCARGYSVPAMHVLAQLSLAVLVHVYYYVSRFKCSRPYPSFHVGVRSYIENRSWEGRRPGIEATVYYCVYVELAYVCVCLKLLT